MEPPNGTWLCPTDFDRARMLDNSARIRRARTIGSLSIAATLIFFGPEFGLWTVLLFALSAINLQTLDRRIERSSRPEYHIAFAIFWTQCILGAAVFLSGGPDSDSMPWLAVPTAFAAMRFRAHVAIAAVVSAIAVLLVAVLAADTEGTFENPGGLLVAVALLVSMTAVTAALSGAEVEHRSGSILDPLTGLLNRSALRRRFDELAEQARLTGEPISLLVCDVDRFKSVNDEHGHADGDAVLRAIAYEMRKQLRSFELIYRLGGEEFLVVLPGAGRADAEALAERVRVAVERARPSGIDVTVSIGVSTSYGGDTGYDELFAAADEALYAAKKAGRNRVMPSTRPVVPATT